MTHYSTLFRTLLISTAMFAIANEGTQGATETPADATPVNSALDILKDEAKVDAIAKAMRSREIFATPAEALAKFSKAAADTDSFYGLPVSIKGLIVGADGNPTLDPVIYANCGVALAYVGERVTPLGGNEKSAKIVGIKAITIFPIPTIDQFIAGEAGKAWVARQIEKECALVFFRPLRAAVTTSELTTAVDKGPATVADYLTEYSRSGSGLDTETFDALWAGFRTALKAQQPVVSKLIPGKAEVIKCIRSKSYATSAFPELETAGMFTRIAELVMNTAKANLAKDGTANPLPVDAIENWVLGRDELNLALKDTSAPDYSVLAGLKF